MTYTLLTYLAKFLDKLGLPGVGEGRVLLLVLGQGVGGIEAVHTEVAQQGLEEVVLGRVLEQVGLEAVCANLNETGGLYQVQLLLLLQTAAKRSEIGLPICYAEDPSDESDIINANAACNQAIPSHLTIAFFCLNVEMSHISLSIDF